MERQRYPGLEIDDDIRQQKSEWVLQRVAWLLFTALLACIMLGLFGRGGPISRVESESDDGLLQVEYERFIRNHSPDKLQLTIQARSDTVRVRLDGEYVRRIQIDQVIPQPERVIGEEGAITYVFNTRASASMRAAIHFSPDHIGKLDGWIAVDGQPRQAFSQFVYP